MKSGLRHRGRRCSAAFAALLALASCGAQATGDGVFAPGVDRRATGEDPMDVGHRLIAAGEHELALRAFARAALDRGEVDAEVLLGMGTANLGLGRINQAERILRVALEKENAWPELYNNLGVVLMEQGEVTEAEAMFRRAFALDAGASPSVRDNLRLAMARKEESAPEKPEHNDYKLVRRGTGDYLIRRTP